MSIGNRLISTSVTYMDIGSLLEDMLNASLNTAKCLYFRILVFLINVRVINCQSVFVTLTFSDIKQDYDITLLLFCINTT